VTVIGCAKIIAEYNYDRAGNGVTPEGYEKASLRVIHVPLEQAELVVAGYRARGWTVTVEQV
jgi:hypothetical protein